MNTINDEFGVVIKIKKLDDDRLRPQKTATTQEPIAAKNSVSSSIHSLNLGDIEKMIYAVIENTNIGIKAKDIADKLRMSRSDVNHYLYGTLKEFVKIDNDYKWHVVKSAKNSCAGSTFLKQDNTNNNRKSIQLKSIDYNLLRNGDVASYIKMFDKLVVSHRNGLNAPHEVTYNKTALGFSNLSRH